MSKGERQIHHDQQRLQKVATQSSNPNRIPKSTVWSMKITNSSCLFITTIDLIELLNSLLGCPGGFSKL